MRHQTGIILAAALVLFSGAQAQETPLSSAFAYQGNLAAAGSPATGTYDMRFRLYDASVGGTQIGSTLCSDDLAVADGRFTASLDFGPAAFAGQKRFLEIEVREDGGLGCSDSSGYSLLTPRQEVTATPHALFALATASAGNAATLNGQPAGFYQNAANLTGTLSSSSLSGIYSSPLSLSNPANTFTGNGASITNLSASNITTGVLDAARLPTNWAAGGDLVGFYPSPTIGPGAVTLSKLESSVHGVLSKLSSLTPVPTVDAVAWGGNEDGQTVVPELPSGVIFIAVAGGGDHSLALRSDGMIAAWGYNFYNQTEVPALPPELRYTAVSGGVYHSLALRSDGQAVAWGESSVGQTVIPALPPAVSYEAVAGGGYHSLALRSDGTVVAWGWNEYGQTNVPVLPPGVTYVSIAGGHFHSLARRSDGTVAAWGLNDFGQTEVPALPPGVSYTAVAAGAFHSLALRSDGMVVAWGMPYDGRIDVPALSPGVHYTAISAGTYHSVALRSDGTVIGWGGNTVGQTFIPELPSDMVYTAVAAGGIHNLALQSSVVVPSLTSTVGLSIGSAMMPPAAGGISVAGDSAFAADVSAASFSGSGAGLTNINAANLIGSIPAAQLTSVPASSLTGSIAPARLTNVPAANLSGSVPAASLTSVPWSSLTGVPANVSSAFSPWNAGGSSINYTGGTVAIGTTTPNAQFSLQAETTTDTQIALTGGPATGGAIPPRTWSIQSSNVNAPLNSRTGSFQIVDRTASVARLLIDTSGNVGINTNSPNQRLTVAGNVNVTGSIAKSGGSFKIDHPLDPKNKYLYHSFVESPDMMNVYNGNITTDGSGYATITLPDYFEALNRDFRYQLTVINEADTGELLWAQVVKKIRGNQFTIRSSRGSLEVSWQITGIRQDAWAEQNRIPNSVDKVGDEKGAYLHPEAFGVEQNHPTEAKSGLQ